MLFRLKRVFRRENQNTSEKNADAEDENNFLMMNNVMNVSESHFAPGGHRSVYQSICLNYH